MCVSVSVCVCVCERERERARARERARDSEGEGKKQCGVQCWRKTAVLYISCWRFVKDIVCGNRNR